MPRGDMGETVFLGYDQAALDREYNNSGKIPNAAEIIAWYPAESARAREDAAHPARSPVRPESRRDARPVPARGPRTLAGPRLRPRRLLAVTRQAGLQLRRARPPARRRPGRGDQLRARPDGRHGRAGAPGARFGGLAPPERRGPRRRPRAAHRLGPLGRRPPGRDADVDRLGALRRDRRRRDQGRLRHQRPLRSRADPPLVPQPDARAQHGDGAAEQPGPLRPGRRGSPPAAPRSEGRRRVPSPERVARRRVAAPGPRRGGHGHGGSRPLLDRHGARRPRHAAQPGDPATDRRHGRAGRRDDPRGPGARAAHPSRHLDRSLGPGDRRRHDRAGRERVAGCRPPWRRGQLRPPGQELERPGRVRAPRDTRVPVHRRATA